jgi:DNA-binding transcriptional LysR family regulator
MRHVSTKLLSVFVLLMEYRDLHAVAVRTHGRVPTVAYGLSRLREITGDPLFVKRNGMLEPTPHALRMEPTARQILAQWANLVSPSDGSAPANATLDLDAVPSHPGSKRMVGPPPQPAGGSLAQRDRHRLGEVR